MLRMALASIFALGATAHAAEPVAPPPAVPQPGTLTAAEGVTALTAFEAAVELKYFDLDKRARVLAALAEGRANGRYALVDPEALAARVTADLVAITGDKHLSLAWRPGSSGSAVEAVRAQYWRELPRRRNYGVEEMRILPGNIRYVRIAAFPWESEAGRRAYDGAMRFVGDGDAAILDLRGNAGGNPAAVNYLTSHFVPEGTLLATYAQGTRTGRSVAQAVANPVVREGAAAIPLYVLVDRRTVSAGEEFAAHVRRLGFARLIGEPTAGASMRNEFVPVPPGFVASISVGTVALAGEGGNWEGTGVAPEVPAASADALGVAQLMALETLAASGPEIYREDYATQAARLRTRLGSAAGGK